MPSRFSSCGITLPVLSMAMLLPCDGGEQDIGDHEDNGPGLTGIVKSMSLSGADLLLLEFLSVEDCVTCTFTGERIARLLVNHTHARVVRICFLACQRQVEALAFQQRAGIYDTVIVDDGTVREAMHLAAGTRFAVVNSRGELLRELTLDGREVRSAGILPGITDSPSATASASQQ